MPFRKFKKYVPLALLILINLFICLYIYQFSTSHDLRHHSNLLFHIPQPSSPHFLHHRFNLPHETKQISFLIDIKLKPGPLKQIHSILANEHFQLLMAGKKNILLQQPNQLTLPNPINKNILYFFPSSFKPRQWNQVGFVFNNSRFSTFINGQLLWETLLTDKKKNLPVDNLTLFPLPATSGPSFPGDSRHALLFNHALSRQEIKQHYLTTFHEYIHNGHPLLLSTLIFLCLTVLSLYIFILAKNTTSLLHSNPTEKEKIIRGLYRITWITLVNILLFTTFNLGYLAAQYFHQCRNFPGPTLYWLILNAVFFIILFTLLLEKITHSRPATCIFHVSAILTLPLMAILLAQLPRFNSIFPIIFNLLLAVGLSMTQTSFDLLRLSESTREKP